MKPDIIIEVYQSKKKSSQPWRWRARDAGNNRKMANGGESYSNQQDCFDAIGELFRPETTVHITWPDGQGVVREGLPALLCEHCGHGIVLHNDDGCTACPPGDCVHR